MMMLFSSEHARTAAMHVYRPAITAAITVLVAVQVHVPGAQAAAVVPDAAVTATHALVAYGA